MTLTVPPSVRTLLSYKTHRFATCWNIRRTDTVSLRFTDHSRQLPLEDGQIYSPLSGGSASARARELGLQDNNAEFRGVLSDDRITDDDLHAKRYDGAQIDEYKVDWRYPWAGAIKHQRYYIYEVSFTGEIWVAQFGGIIGKLKKPVGRVCSRNCENIVGDKNCTVDLTDDAYHFQASVDSISDDRLEFISSDGGLSAYATNFFSHGYLLWLSGDNAGLKSPVKSFTYTGAGPFTIQLFLSTPFAMQAGDQFDIVTSCSGERSECKTKFNNLLNFWGTPDMPGTDKLVKVAGS